MIKNIKAMNENILSEIEKMDMLESLLMQAIICANNGEKDHAEKLAREAYALCPENDYAKQSLSSILAIQGKIKEADRLFSKISKKIIMEPLFLAIMAREALFVRNHKIAEKYIAKGLKKDDKYAPFYFLKGCIQFNERNFNKAAAAYKKCMALDSAGKYAQRIKNDIKCCELVLLSENIDPKRTGDIYRKSEIDTRPLGKMMEFYLSIGDKENFNFVVAVMKKLDKQLAIKLSIGQN